MSNNKHTGRGVFGKGYYIALILCAAAIGISGYLYYRNANQTETALQEPDTQVTDLPAEATPNEDVAAVATQPQDAASAVGTESTAATAGKPLKTGAPLEGTTVAAYAMDCLSYNETTRDWRVHNGMDIAAEEGTPVLAAADGTVYTTYSDDSMGTTVVIRHDGGYTTMYSSLSEELSVKTGDTVELGQVIGCVGSTALVENALGPHVHFSVTYRDAQMDPMEFLNMEA